jgi:hypothetical protein
MLGNSAVYVTCNCLIRAYLEVERNPNKPAGRVRYAKGNKMSETVSLGDFPVGTPSEQLVAAYEQHLAPPINTPNFFLTPVESDALRFGT